MIWTDGRVVADDALAVSVLDRTFEHGLGLFETLRTWGGRAPLLDRHLARLSRSAGELGLSLEGVRLPDAEAVSELVAAAGLGADVVLRITLSGGLASRDGGGASLWIRPAPLPLPPQPKGAVVLLGGWFVFEKDPMARHKSLNYWARRRAYESARAQGFDENLSRSFGHRVWEGSRTNLFIIKDDTLMTPDTSCPMVPGIMRELVLSLALDIPLHDVVECEGLSIKDLADADEVFLTNSVRGIIPVSRVVAEEPPGLGQNVRRCPGRWTQRLSIAVSDRLRSGGPPT
jgi:branched-subunit amino acid aminotransferase/4-amino-4-deoxychorismate lyase